MAEEPEFKGFTNRDDRMYSNQVEKLMDKLEYNKSQYGDFLDKINQRTFDTYSYALSLDRESLYPFKKKPRIKVISFPKEQLNNKISKLEQMKRKTRLKSSNQISVKIA